MLCPVCAVDLVMSERQGVEIDYCPNCRGVWLDRGELEKIIQRAAAFDNPPAPVRNAPTTPPKAKNDYRVELDDDDTDYPRRPAARPQYDEDEYDYRKYDKNPKKKKKDFLEDIFDIFG
ncbi:MAG: hypothetical protein OHK0046_32930 [Anaerolineae bacterium]